MSERNATAFDPGQHLSTIKGQEYLEVKWRLAWLRAEQPDAIIETKLMTNEHDRAIFYARVALQDGASATGWGSETAASFGNYIEKAETKALGRALAALGFGTQFCPDFEDGAESGMLADAPVQRGTPRQQQARQQFQGQGRPAANGSGPGSASEKQIGALYSITKSMGWSREGLTEYLGKAPDHLTSAEASAAITDLNAIKAESGVGS